MYLKGGGDMHYNYVLIATKGSRLSVSNVRTVCKQSPDGVKCNHTLNRPQAEVYIPDAAFRMLVLGTDYAVKTSVKKI